MHMKLFIKKHVNAEKILLILLWAVSVKKCDCVYKEQ